VRKAYDIQPTLHYRDLQYIHKCQASLKAQNCVSRRQKWIEFNPPARRRTWIYRWTACWELWL